MTNYNRDFYRFDRFAWTTAKLRMLDFLRYSLISRKRYDQSRYQTKSRGNK